MRKFLWIVALLAGAFSQGINAQDAENNNLVLSGELFSDQRFLLNETNNWAWNETRLSLELDKYISGSSKFHSEIWLRNMGLPSISSTAGLYNKGIVDPYNLEIREAYVQLNSFLFKNLDLKIGRQQITWGTADKLNPTSNLNPYDMEDILDFGRRRGTDAITMNYYFSNNLSLQAAYVPLFRPANLPVGIFANTLNQGMALPAGLVLKGTTDTLLMPDYTITESASAGVRLKGFVAGMDISASYVYGLDCLPYSSYNALIPVDLTGGITVNSELSFARNHIIGLDLATSLAGIGIWAEAALFIPTEDMVMTTDLSALYPLSPVPVTMDSTLVAKDDPYLKFIVGADYFFPDGSYFNFQYMHGFIHERGNSSLNDYFFLQYYKRFFNDKLKIAPLGGGFIVSDWEDVKNNYALVYMPEIALQATPNAEISLSAVLFDGAGENLFAGLVDYNMFIAKLKYSF